MSMTIHREILTGRLTPSQHEQLSDELSLATGVRCEGIITKRGRDINDAANPAKDRLELVFAAAPNTAALDEALAAFPATPTGATGTFDVAADNTYFLARIPVAPGESVALSIQLHAVLGTAADFEPIFVTTRACVYRLSSGAVRATSPSGIHTGNIPSFAVQLTASDAYADVSLTLRATGTLTLISSEVAIVSKGTLPA